MAVKLNILVAYRFPGEVAVVNGWLVTIITPAQALTEESLVTPWIMCWN